MGSMTSTPYSSRLPSGETRGPPCTSTMEARISWRVSAIGHGHPLDVLHPDLAGGRVLGEPRCAPAIERTVWLTVQLPHRRAAEQHAVRSRAAIPLIHVRPGHVQQSRRRSRPRRVRARDKSPDGQRDRDRDHGDRRATLEYSFSISTPDRSKNLGANRPRDILRRPADQSLLGETTSCPWPLPRSTAVSSRSGSSTSARTWCCLPSTSPSPTMCAVGSRLSPRPATTSMQPGPLGSSPTAPRWVICTGPWPGTICPASSGPSTRASRSRSRETTSVRIQTVIARRPEIEPLIDRFAQRQEIVIRSRAADGTIEIGGYLFDEPGFAELVRYLWRGGFPRWRDDRRPAYVDRMMEAVRSSPSWLFLGEHWPE